MLIVGAGSVGQVYGRHLQLGGASVSFFVKPKYVQSCRAGLTVYPLNEKPRFHPTTFSDFGVFSEPGEVAEQSWDQVWLTIPSDALKGPWLDPLLDAIGKPTLVSLQPGTDARNLLLDRWEEERLVSGLIVLISYPAPLPDEELERPGTAYWFPPLSASPFGGPKDRARQVVKALKRGGCPAKLNRRTANRAALSTAVFMPPIVALEGEQWSFHRFFRGDLLKLAATAAREAIGTVAAELGVRPSWYRFALRSILYRIGFWFSSKVAPFNMELYLKKHFSKVGSQTRYLIENYVEMGKKHELPTPSLQELQKRVFGIRRENQS